MKEAGGTVMGLDWRVSLADARRRLGKMPVMGNMDPAILLSGRPQIRAEVKRLLKEAGNRPGYVFNLGHGILPETPFDNVRFLVECVKES
jgi:uroporphyrinogen decarboxylase